MTLEGIGSARELARRCERDIPYMWLCGGIGINYHMLSDFRVGQGEFLEQLLTDGEVVTFSFTSNGFAFAIGFMETRRVSEDVSGSSSLTRRSCNGAHFKSTRDRTRGSKLGALHHPNRQFVGESIVSLNGHDMLGVGQAFAERMNVASRCIGDFGA